MLLRRIALALFLILPGLAIAAFCLFYALKDWGQLQIDYKHFQSVASSTVNLTEVFKAYTAQDIHRTNLFADVVWALLGSIIAGLGILGICLLPKKSANIT